MKKIFVIALMVAPALASAQQKTVECYCTDKTGSRIELGETICMSVDGRQFMAQCQMSLNNPMWRQVSDGCFTS